MVDIDGELARCNEDDLDLLLLLQDLNDESVETEEPLVWSKLELVGFVELIFAGSREDAMVVLTQRGRLGVRAVRRARGAA